MLLTWLRTVASPTTSMSAISWLLMSRASNRSTSSSRWRAVPWSIPFGSPFTYFARPTPPERGLATIGVRVYIR
jgi:hypothetical protein